MEATANYQRLLDVACKARCDRSWKLDPGRDPGHAAAAEDNREQRHFLGVPRYLIARYCTLPRDRKAAEFWPPTFAHFPPDTTEPLGSKYASPAYPTNRSQTSSNMPAFWKAWKDQENDPRPGQPAAVQQPPAAQPTVTPAPPPPPPAQPAAQAGRTRTQPLPQASSGDKTSRTSTFPRIIGVRGRTASGKLPQYNGPPLHKEFFRRYALEWDTLCDWLIKAFPEDKYPGLKFKEEFVRRASHQADCFLALRS